MLKISKIQHDAQNRHNPASCSKSANFRIMLKISQFQHHAQNQQISASWFQHHAQNQQVSASCSKSASFSIMLEISKFQHHSQHHANMQRKRRIPILPAHIIYKPETSLQLRTESRQKNSTACDQSVSKRSIHICNLLRNDKLQETKYRLI